MFIQLFENDETEKQKSCPVWLTPPVPLIMNTETLINQPFIVLTSVIRSSTFDKYHINVRIKVLKRKMLLSLLLGNWSYAQDAALNWDPPRDGVQLSLGVQTVILQLGIHLNQILDFRLHLCGSLIRSSLPLSRFLPSVNNLKRLVVIRATVPALTDPGPASYQDPKAFPKPSLLRNVLAGLMTDL